MEALRKYRRFLWITLGNAVCLLLCVFYVACWHKVPGSIRLRAGTRERVSFGVPASGRLYRGDEAFLPVSLDRPLTFYASWPDEYELDVRLFGFLPFKSVSVQVVQERRVVPAGLPVGIYVKTQGVLVVGTGEFTGFDRIRYAPAASVLQSGDYILRMNGLEVTGKRMFMRALQELQGDDLVLTIQRGDETFDVRLEPVKDRSGTYKIGVWIRDNAQGVGTLTYIDEDGGFGALGHGINDTDTSTLMTLRQGALYRTDIIGIRKGESGSPGELTGLIEYADGNVIGRIERNEENGIFGVCGEELEDAALYEPVPVGLKQEVVVGPAKLLCSLDGRETKLYDLEITEISYDEAHVNREMTLRITDEELIGKTGGIIQGMSGAPILQNGKLIGAVTHVFVQDATKGYGIFIEEMLE